MKRNTRFVFILLFIAALAMSCGSGGDGGHHSHTPISNTPISNSPITNSPISNTPTLAPPTNIQATNGTDITVSWDPQPGLCYNLYWNTTGGVTKADNKLNNVSPPYVHTGLINDITYYYAVTATDCSGQNESGLSVEVTAISENLVTELQKMAASDAQDGDKFGYAVSINGDYAIVGAYMEDGTGTNRGAAYVFYRNHGGTDNWGQVKKLTASDAADADMFGMSVSIDGDYIIVGAPDKDGSGFSQGAAYVFYRNQDGTDNWGEVTKLTASDAADGDMFGYSVSLNGDLVIVGAPQKDGRGAAYLFNRNQGGTNNWGEVKKLTASDASGHDFFGNSISMSGDYTIVGAYRKDNGGTEQGAAYVFYRNQGGTDNWGEVKKLTAPDAKDYDWFGFVSINGDYAVVGAPTDFTSSDGWGEAYVFYRNQDGTDNWGMVTKLVAPDAESFDGFGNEVSISGDYVVVAAWAKASQRGAAYVFYRNQGGTDNWGEVTKLAASDAAPNDLFGAVAISGDDIIVGAYGEDGAGGLMAMRGAAYLYNVAAF